MLHTPLYYNKNNYERKEDEINSHIQHSGWHPVVALLTLSWWLHHTTAPHIHTVSSFSQQWWGVLSLSLTFIGPPLPVITHMHKSSSL